MAVRLVSPDRVLHVVPNKNAVRPLVDQLGLDKKKSKELAGNLRQFCGGAEVGEDRQGRDEASNWLRLDSIVWLKHDSSAELVPLGQGEHRRSALPLKWVAWAKRSNRLEHINERVNQLEACTIEYVDSKIIENQYLLYH